MSKLNKIIYLDSAEQFVELYQNGTVTKANGVVVTYNENDLYLIAKKPITVDSELNPTSENPVKNKVLFERFEDIDDELSQMFGRGDVADFAGLRVFDGHIGVVDTLGNGEMILMFPNYIEFNQLIGESFAYPKLFGHRPSGAPNSAQEEFYLPDNGGTLATEEGTQIKLYRHTIYLRDTEQEITLRFILKNSKRTAYTFGGGNTGELAELFRELEYGHSGTFRVVEYGAPEGSGMITSHLSEFMGFDFVKFSRNATTYGHINVFDADTASSIVLEVSDTVEEI